MVRGVDELERRTHRRLESLFCVQDVYQKTACCEESSCDDLFLGVPLVSVEASWSWRWTKRRVASLNNGWSQVSQIAVIASFAFILSNLILELIQPPPPHHLSCLSTRINCAHSTIGKMCVIDNPPGSHVYAICTAQDSRLHVDRKWKDREQYWSTCSRRRQALS